MTVNQPGDERRAGGRAKRDLPGVETLLEAAVLAIGGRTRPGQVTMAQGVAHAAEEEEHLLVQAGTGTGKSLAYLVPAVAAAMQNGDTVVVSTATLALQSQIVERDLPRLADALEGLLGRRPTWQLVKGRANYLCRHKLDGGYPDEDEGLFAFAEPAAAAAPSWLGAQVVRLREWAERTSTGDRDELVPGVNERAWRQVSVSARECLATSCPLVNDCFCESARERARQVDIVVTNHAMLAIDAFESRHLLPEHRLLIVDEAHELADRVTAVLARELTTSAIVAAGRRARGCGIPTDELDDAATLYETALVEVPEGRLTELPQALALAVAGVRDAVRELVSRLKTEERSAADGARSQAKAALGEVFDVADRLCSDSFVIGGPDVVWLARTGRPESGVRTALALAPLSVAVALREKLFGDRTAVLTSATLAVGGSFDAVSGRLGLQKGEWVGLDVGSPFDYPKQGILYVARHLPTPGRDGLSEQLLDELEELVRAAGGRTLGLFSSRRAAEAAAAAMRERLDVPVLCQGDDVTATLVRSFSADPATCLFGTLSLWQGVDVPGESCQLVVIDRIPFPRPDDPLGTARQQAVAKAGGNAFMSVAATHAALLLAQGVGRLVRSSEDRGVVAVLDPRLATARYASFLRASLPPMWATTDRDVVFGALGRLTGQAPTAMRTAEVS